VTKVNQQFQYTELANGIQVVTEYIPHVHSFSLGFWVNIGTRDERISENGICHFIEHMLFKGTKNRTSRQISETIESYGGHLNAFTTKEHTCFYGRGLKDHLPRTFDVLSDMLKHPLFRAGDIKKEAGVIIDELRDIEDNPEEYIFDKFEELIFQGNTLAQPIIGNESSISGFDNQMLHEFHKRHYGANNLLVAASGNIEHNRVVELTRQHLSHRLSSKQKPRRQARINRPAAVTLNKDISQVHCVLGVPTYGYRSELRLPLSILSIVLGEGASSRLFQSIRERHGITYQINSFLNSYSDCSTFGVYFSTSEKNLQKALNAISSEFAKLRDKKIGNRELRRVKEFIKGHIILGLENTTTRMIRMAGSIVIFKRFVPVEEVMEKIEAVSADTLHELANEVLIEEQLTRVILRAGKPESAARVH
jgi:predicted Zn-dependent peptidase